MRYAAVHLGASMNREHTHIARQLLLLGAFLQREANRLLAASGLNQQQFVVLKEIEERGPVSQKDVCSALIFEKSNVSKIVKKLETAGLVRSAQDRDDSRITRLSVTAKGRSVIGHCMDGLNRWNADWLKSVPDDELRSIAAALRKLIELPA